MKVVKRDGIETKFDPVRIREAIYKAAESIGDLDKKKIKSITEKVIAKLNKETIDIEEIQDKIEETLVGFGEYKMAKAFILYRQKRKDSRRLAASLGVQDDMRLHPSSLAVFARRYLLKDEHGKVKETPLQLFKRVSKTISEIDRNYGKSVKEINSLNKIFFNLMADGFFLPNSPTLMNAGAPLGQLSACFVLPVEDSIESIFKTLETTARIHQTGGGCVEKGTKIYIEGKGLVPIEYIELLTGSKVKEGESLDVSNLNLRTLSFNSTEGKFELKAIRRLWKFKSSEGVRIRTSNGAELVTSIWHPYLTVERRKLAYEHLSKKFLFKEKRADEIEIGEDILDTFSGMERLLPTSNEEDWVIGYFLGDGSIDKKRIRFFDSEKRNLERVLSFANTFMKRKVTCLTKDPRSDCFSITISNRKFRNFIIDKLGKLEHKLDAEFPSCTNPKHLIAGLLDSDGYIGKDGKSSFYTEKESWKTSFMEYLSLLGIRSHSRIRRGKYGWKDGFEVTFSTSKLTGFPLTKDLPETRDHFYRASNKVIEREVLERNIEFYDLTVDGNETYLAGNKALLVSHNTGFNFSKLRPAGDVVKSTGGIASGPVSFMKVYDAATEEIKQGGKRRGANMGLLDVNHPNILDFITSKSQGGLRNFNISVGVTDQFMQAVQKNGHVSLCNPRTKETVQTIPARAIWDLITAEAWKTGDPGLIFLDTINRSNSNSIPKYGPINITNPCVTGDSWTMTLRGPKQVKDLTKETCYILNAEEKWGTPFRITGKKPVFEIITQEGFSIKATKDHRFRTLRGDKQLRDLKAGDKLVLDKEFYQWDWREENPVPNPFIMQGYLIGNLFGDGFWGKTGGTLYSWENEKDYASSARMVCIAGWLIKNGIHRQDFKGWQKRDKNGRMKLKMEWLRDLLLAYQVPLGKKIITKKMEEAPFGFCKGFLQGLFDADGSVQGTRKKGFSVRLSQSDYGMLQTVQRMLLRCGIFSRIYKRREEGLRALPDGKGGCKNYKCRAQFELVISGDSMEVFKEKINFWDLLKIRKLGWIHFPRGPYKQPSEATFLRAEYKGLETVYDTQLDGHYLSANGFIIHNCGEVPLYPFESCNLGSINLSKFVLKNGKGNGFDWKSFKETVAVVIHFLDNVIDANKYPVKEIEEMSRKTRRIGLGIMGWADLLVNLNIPYDSEEALELAKKIMKELTETGRKESERLGSERGNFPDFKDSIWFKKGCKSMRNSTVSCIAPTGSISILAGCSSGIEPLFSIVTVRHLEETLGTELVDINSYFENVAIKEGFYSEDLIEKVSRSTSIKNLKEIPEDVRRVFVTAHDISPEWHVRMQAAFQEYTDNAVSKTVNLPNLATPHDVEQIYLQAWKFGCKGITIFRSGSMEKQVITCRECEIDS